MDNERKDERKDEIMDNERRDEPIIKKIVVSFDPPPRKEKKEKTVKTQKEKQKRQITTTHKWNFTPEELGSPYQWSLLQNIKTNDEKKSEKREKKEHCDFIIRQINQKIYGYKAQDIEKDKLNEEKLVNIDNVLELMLTCENKCYYCKETVNVLYEYVREPKQWTLDRLDNDYGHNNDNVVISCLSCNLRRKTMHPERYVFTKQLNILKLA
jgi:hypothetical protein